MRTDQTAPQPTQGHMVAHTHVLPMRIYFEDTDATQTVYHANYLRYAERARYEMLRCLGIDLGPMLDGEGIFFVIRRCDATYRKPARLNDALEVRSRLIRAHGARLDGKQVILRDGETLVELAIQTA